MSLTNAPAVITQLDTQLRACASYPVGMTTWYPDALGSTAIPFATLAEDARSMTPYAAGAGAIAGGTLVVGLHVDDTVGNVEALARALLDELLAQQSGIVFRAGECGLSTEPTPGEVAGGHSEIAILMTLPWGLSV